MKKDYLIIDRAKWRTGNTGGNFTGKGYTSLLNEDGYMCCLGFRCHQMGIPKRDLLNKSTPNNLSHYWKIPDLIDSNGRDSDFTYGAIDINDDRMLTSKEREKAIIEHFATKNIIVEFKGKYKK